MKACTGRDASAKVWGWSGVDRVLVRYISDTSPIHLRYTSDISLVFGPVYAWASSAVVRLESGGAGVGGARGRPGTWEELRWITVGVL